MLLVGLAATVVLGPLAAVGAVIATAILAAGERVDSASFAVAGMGYGGLLGLLGFWICMLVPTHWLLARAWRRTATLMFLLSGALAASGGSIWFSSAGGGWMAGVLALLAVVGGVMAWDLSRHPAGHRTGG